MWVDRALTQPVTCPDTVLLMHSHVLAHRNRVGPVIAYLWGYVNLTLSSLDPSERHYTIDLRDDSGVLRSTCLKEFGHPR